MGRAPADFTFESAARARGYLRVAGVDEAGRGPLAGPVVAAAVILDPERTPEGLADSKTLSGPRRATLHAALLEVAEVSTGLASVAEIDAFNILQASHLAMCRALEGLHTRASFALIDGNLVPKDLDLPCEAVVKGDVRCLSIAAASIVAKETRDKIMVDLAQQFPGYGWEQNAAYPTRAHLEAIRYLGVTAHHRRSFKPVHNILCRGKSLSD